MYDCDKGFVLENGPVSVSIQRKLETKLNQFIFNSQAQRALVESGRHQSCPIVFQVNIQGFAGIVRSVQ